MDEESLHTVMDILVGALRDGATEVRVKIKSVVGEAGVNTVPRSDGRTILLNRFTITEDLG